MKIILATKSERRKELFKKICKGFDVIESNFDERSVKEEDPVKYAVLCAIGKAEAIAKENPDKIVIGADTIVSLNDEIIGKPKDYEEAKQILKRLSGTKHKVITGIAIYRKDQEKLLTDYEISYVKFKKLSEQEIEEYLKKENFFDKAGAYAIQNVKDNFVEEIDGNFDNVVGLPTGKLKKLLDRFLSNEISVEIYDFAFPNNWGIGRYNNLVIFVPGGIVGDRLKVKVSKELKNYSFGEIIEIEKKSDFRINPECEHFGLCGGCSFQNLVYEKQLELKKEYFLNCLKKIGQFEQEIKVENFFQSPLIFFYRNKMEFAFGVENSRIVVGLRERSLPYKKYKKEVVPLKRCLIFSKKVEKIFPIVSDFFNSIKLQPYDPFTKKGVLRHLVVKESKNNNKMMVIIVTKSGINLDLSKLVDLLTEQVKEIKSIYWVENDQIADVVAYERGKLLYGQPYIEEIINNLSFRIYPNTFFQPNTKSAEILYQKIFENIDTGSKIIGLYCGTGPIEISISKKAKEVIGVDWDIANIQTANENCRENYINNCIFFAERVEKFLNKKEILVDCDYLIVDPPRNGLSSKIINKISKNKIPNIIYVSCNPSTLARDLKEFKGNGYSIKKIFLFDFFPHTSHLESLTILEYKSY
ncbi:MAG: 23S rRNA (uracil(1939)-C(5))-methyltransferase RlmD [Candidatus Omnitrophica bacterium]|nr:23S rRNA (uracil(1939)-C(5))-methyltransferase RlmD [Candidatus Omnitrophota bacterium]MCM8801716.1 23S rRNA (uracil(1939)-C(5))-methyltransferase RlmD [Candidatus Omnitrophota bacterium]